MGDLESAISYYAREIYQMDLILQGVLGTEFRDYVIEKRKYYHMALRELVKKIGEYS